MDDAQGVLGPSNPPTQPVEVVPSSAALRAQIYRSLPSYDRAEVITDRLRDSIAVGLLHQGDRLPSEVDMSESFGVAPATLREALSKLRDEGLVETRRGRNGGTFVVSYPEARTHALLQRFRDYTVVDLRDLGDEITAITAACCRLAAERAVHHDLERLGSLLAEFRKARTPHQRSRSDSRFWLELAVAAQSRRLLSLALRLQLEVSELLWSPLVKHRDHAGAVAQLQDLYQTLVDRDSRAAVEAASARVSADTYHLIDVKLTLSLNDEQDGGTHGPER